METPDAHTMTVIDAGVRQRLLRHLDNCVSEVDTDLRPPLPNPEERLQPPDSSTAEEVNNNGRDPISQPEFPNQLPPTAAVAASVAAAAASLPTKMVKTYDGNFVFVLPSHYLQLATALGINIRAQSVPNADQASGCSNVKQEKCEDFPPHPIEKGGTEKPIDFSRNNETHDMWRPW